MTNFNFLLNNLSYLSSEDLVGRPMDSTCFRSAPVPPSFRLRLHPLRMVATLLLLLSLSVGEVWGDTYVRLTSIADIDEDAEYVLGIEGTGFHYSGTSSWGLTALPSAQTPLKYKLKKGDKNASFTASTKISSTTYYLQVPTSNTFGMTTSLGTNTTLIIGTTLADAGDGKEYAIANSGTTTRHLRRNGASGLRSYASTTGNIAFFYKVVSATPCTVTWHVNGSTTTAGSPTTNSTIGSKVTTLPTNPTSSECDNSKIFVGWSRTPIVGTTNTKPSDLFTTAEGSPTLIGNTDFYAVFANQVSAGGTLETMFNITDYSGTPTNWSNHNVNFPSSSYICFDAGGDSLTSPLLSAHNSVQVTCSIATYGGSTSPTDHPLTVYLLDENDKIIDTKSTATPTTTSYIGSGTLSFGNISHPFKIRFYLPSANRGVRLRAPKCTGTTLPTYNGYRTSCCTALGSINGSFLWSN